MTLPPVTAAHVDAIAARTPDRLAVHDDEGPVSYGELAHRVARCAQILAGLGMRSGNRAAIAGPGLALQLVVSLAVEGLGGVTSTFAAEGDAATQVLFRHVQWVIAGLLQQVPPNVRFVLVDPAFLLALQRPLEGVAPTWAELPADAPARLARTSGSTGLPKLMLHDRAGLEWWMASAYSSCLLTRGPDSRMLMLCPLLVGGAIARASAALRIGGAVLGGSRIDLASMRPTSMFGLSLQLEQFLDALPPGIRLAAPIASSIVGGPVPRTLRERAALVLGVPVHNRYGLNECGPICEVVDADGVGTVMPGVEVRILDDSGRDLPLGAIGTVALRTPGTVRGYLDEPAASARAFCDGWFVTGDAGVQLARGVLRLLGRRDDVVAVWGIKVPASELEDRLTGLDSLASAAVMSVQLDGGRTTLGVAAVLAPGCTVAQAGDALAGSLADVAALGIRLVTLDALPRLPGGKVDRAALLRLFLAADSDHAGRSTAAQVGAIAAREPDRLAIHDDDGPLTYGELYHRVQRCAQMLAALGLRAGDRVAIGGPGLARQIVVTLAVEGLGGVTASFTAEGDSAADALFRHVQWVLAGQPQAVPEGVRFVALDESFLAGLRHPLDGASLAWPALPDAAPTRLARTSGSTGAAKFLLHSRRGQDWWIDEAGRSSVVGGRDARMLLLCPLLAGGAYARVSACLRTGAAVLAAEHMELDVLRPTFVFGLPAHLDWFVHALPARVVLRAPIASSVAGGAVPRPLRDRVAAVLRGPVNNTFGSNEAGPVCDHVDVDGVGTLVPGVEVRILDQAGRDLPDGESGILAVRTPLVGTGYLEPVQASGLRDGWFVSSDLCARVGPDRLRLFGRCDDLVVVGGLKIPALALEERLSALPSLAAAAVQSAQGDGGCTTLGVAVVLAAGHSAEQARTQVADALADIAALGIRLLVLDRLPLLPGGKVDRPALLRRLLGVSPR